MALIVIMIMVMIMTVAVTTGASVRPGPQSRQPDPPVVLNADIAPYAHKYAVGTHAGASAFLGRKAAATQGLGTCFHKQGCRRHPFKAHPVIVVAAAQKGLRRQRRINKVLHMTVLAVDIADTRQKTTKGQDRKSTRLNSSHVA